MKTMSEFLWSLIHPGPICTLILIKTISLSVIYTSLMWWPLNTILGFLSLISFLVSAGLVIFNFFSAISNGPGILPFKWVPDDIEDCKKLQYCAICEGYKAPRAHHCSKCKRCVMKLDHHCPWINSCVGHKNHAYFVFFLMSRVLGCTQACVILGCSLYRAIFWSYYVYHDVHDVPLVYLGVYGFLWVMFSLGCAVGVALGCAVLLFYQLRIISRNKTTIEDWIVEKAEYRRKQYPEIPALIFPYDLGWKKNFSLVLNLSCEPIGDGISWPVKEGCDQYTLTIEQKLQKDEKKKRTKEYKAIDKYGGAWFPITKGIGTFFHPPCSDETRMKIEVGDQIMVTRWKKYWLYGQKANEKGELLVNNKGWFPRKVAVQVVSNPNMKSYQSEDEPEGNNLETKDIDKSSTKVNDKKKKKIN